MVAQPKRRRPGGRTARNTETVHAAVLALLAERMPGEISMPMIAEGAGVAATSLYRRWGDVRSLLLEAAVAGLMRDHPLPDTGSLRGDLSTWARSVAKGLAAPKGALFLRIQLSFGRGAPAIAAMAPRLAQVEEMLTRARLRGEATPQLLQVTDHILGPLYLHALFNAPADEAAAERFVEDVLTLAAVSKHPG